MSIRPVGQRAAKTVTLAVVVAGVAAAAVHAAPARADVPVQATVTRDLATWAMPLDAYVTPAGSISDQAEDVLVGRCLRAAGLRDWDPPRRTATGLQADEDAHDDAADANPSPGLATTRPLAADQAAERGYHAPDTSGANAEAWKAWAFDPARNTELESLPDGTFDGCLGAARKRLGTLVPGRAEAASELAQRLTYLAALDAREDPAVVRASARWAVCMSQAGVRGLPDAPSGMPTAQMSAAWALGLAGTAPREDEVRTAEQDVSCQGSSGYRRALYDAEWSRLTRVTAADAVTLQQGSTRNPELRERLVAVLDRQR